MFEAIEATDWFGIPGPAVIYEPETIVPALRALASATDEASADAVIRPLDGGLYHSHSGCVHPAALVAAPILLDIAENGPSAAFGSVCDLLDTALTGCPWVEDAGDSAVVLPCCAIAELVRARAAMLEARGQAGVSLLKEANLHWSLTVSEFTPDRWPGSLLVLGRLVGDPGRTYAPCEVRVPGRPALRTETCVTIVSAPADRRGGEALIRLSFAEMLRIEPGHVMAAPCHENVF